MYTENFYYGKSSNPVDNLPKVGRKNELLEKQMYDIVAEEMRQKDLELER